MADTEKKRGVLLTIWLILISIGNVIFGLDYIGLGLWVGIIPFMISGFLLLNLVFILFIFLWKKWAFFAFCGSSVIVFIMQYVFVGLGVRGLTIEVVILLGVPVVLYLLMRPKWYLFE